MQSSTTELEMKLYLIQIEPCKVAEFKELQYCHWQTHWEYFICVLLIQLFLTEIIKPKIKANNIK